MRGTDYDGLEKGLNWLRGGDWSRGVRGKVEGRLRNHAGGMEKAQHCFTELQTGY